MVTVILKMNALPKKRLEIKQSCLALVESIRKEKGCLSSNVFQDIENDNAFSMIQIWQSRNDLDDHLRSENFTLMMGTRHLLSRPLAISMSEDTSHSGWQAVESVRR